MSGLFSDMEQCEEPKVGIVTTERQAGMTCPRCHGASIFSALSNCPVWAANWVKCLSCSHEWDPTQAQPVTRHEAPVKPALPQPEEMMMPKGWTEERRKKFKATMAAKRKKNDDEGFIAGFMNPVEAVPLTDLDLAIDQARADLEALERAKAILERRAQA